MSYLSGDFKKCFSRFSIINISIINRKKKLFKTTTGMDKYQRHSIKIDFLEKGTLATYPEHLNKQKVPCLIHGVIAERT